MWDYEFQMRFASWLHEKKDAVRTCCLIGIRTQESFNRWRCIYLNRKYQMYHRYRWTSKVGNDIFNAYPIYDWKTTYGLLTESLSGITINYTTITIGRESIWNVSALPARS